ncbi:hypothetical protein CDD83_5439 [Cordyceps sp. RAO-2017]|nr:hypothetical protein CDD83_5439 [Cordyceps sp. RAO-2017]
MASPSFCQRTEAFLHWFQALPGSTFSDSIQTVDLRSRNAGRGIVATRDIPADTTLFTIPRRSIMSIETSPLRQKLPHLFESQGDGDDEQALDPWSALILVLVHEYFLGPSSLWEPYMAVLPETFDTPMFWSDEELAELQASPLLSKIGRAEADDMFRAKLLPIIRSRPMGSTIMAYAFDLENDEDGSDNDDGWVEDREGRSMLGMVPMADLLNADADFNAHVNHGDDHLTVTSLRPIKAGEEILNYYGPHPNSELLRRYGYVTDKHSRYDVVEIAWSVVEGAAAAHLGLSEDVVEKARARTADDDFEDSFVLERDSGDPNPDGTLASSAALHEMPAELRDQLKRFLKAVQKLDGRAVQDKRGRDEAQQAILARSILAVESQYPTTGTQDELRLRQEDMSQRRRMAVQVRLGEKRLLEEAKSLLSASSADDLFDGQPASLKRPRRLS